MFSVLKTFGVCSLVIGVQDSTFLEFLKGEEFVPADLVELVRARERRGTPFNLRRERVLY